MYPAGCWQAFSPEGGTNMEKTLETSDVKETRIALAFFGGVALAVYESGVAYEFFRLVKGEGLYAKLRRKVGPVVVDIITGTSAGGLNGAFLANALVNRGDMLKLMSLWLEEGDLGKLLYGPFKTGPRSLLDGDYFLQKIFEALMSRRATPVDERYLQPYLDLYITATNLSGERVVIETPAGEELDTRTHRQIFRFRYQEADPVRGIDEINNFKSEEDVCRLARASRASASFPLAFEPVLVRKAEFGEHAQWLEADAYHIDGGVLDNKPIAKALEAIAERRADRFVERLLFYIEPDPEEIKSRACGSAPREIAPAKVAIKALMELPGYQSITAALQQIERHNRNVTALRRTLDYYETAAGRFRSEQREERRKFKLEYISPSNGPTALFRAQEDGYLDLRLRQDVSLKIFRFLSELTITASCSELSDERLIELTPVAERMGNALKPTIYSIKSTLLGALDLKYARRRCRYLVQVIRSLYPPLPPDTETDPEKTEERRRLLAVTRKLSSLKDFLYEQEERVLRYERFEKDRVEAFSAEVEARLQALCEQVLALRLSIPSGTKDLLKQLNHGFNADPGMREEWNGFWRIANTSEPDLDERLQALCRLVSTARSGGSTIDEEVKEQLQLILHAIGEAQRLAGDTLESIRKSKLVARREEFCQGLYDTIHRKITTDTDELNRLIPRGSTSDGELKDFAAWIHLGAWKLRDALDSFYLRDMIIYPLTQAEEVGSELQQVNFARISPGDAKGFLPGLTAKEKVAGEKFAHFGGFFSKKWRGNDLTWGRLDTAEIIICKLLPGPEHEAERKDLIEQAHEEILDEMRELGAGIYNRTDNPEHKDLIGKEDISAIPAGRKLDWAARGLLTFLKMGRKSWADTKVAGWVPKVTALFDWVIGFLIAVVFLFSWIGHRLFRWRVLGYVLAAIFFMAIGIVLWNYSLEDLWTKLLPARNG
ncbi:MAG: patatin-like protein [Desulfobacteraceae bacterium]|nr:MAG: patatin-like protein [Desulfobacteraceae bacterium]